MNKKLDKHYVSESDQFLAKLRKEIPEAPAQKDERLKHERIGHLRDNCVEDQQKTTIWQDF